MKKISPVNIFLAGIFIFFLSSCSQYTREAKKFLENSDETHFRGVNKETTINTIMKAPNTNFYIKGPKLIEDGTAVKLDDSATIIKTSISSTTYIVDNGRINPQALDDAKAHMLNYDIEVQNNPEVFFYAIKLLLTKKYNASEKEDTVNGDSEIDDLVHDMGLEEVPAKDLKYATLYSKNMSFLIVDAENVISVTVNMKND